MLKTWSVQNFKSAFDNKPIEFAPLTIFAGANSSGKSTIIQSILLTAQTVQSPVSSRAIVLNGHIVRLGAYSDIVSRGRDQDEVSVAFEIEPVAQDYVLPTASSFYRYYRADFQPGTTIWCEFSFSSNGPDTEREILQLQPRLESTTLKLKLPEPTLDTEVSVRRSKESPYERAAKFQVSESLSQAPELPSLEYEVLKPVTFKASRRFARYGSVGAARSAGASMTHFLPGAISIVFDAVEEEVNRIMDSLLGPPREGRGIEDSGDQMQLSPRFIQLMLHVLGEFARSQIQPELFNARRLPELWEDLFKSFDLKKYFRFALRLSSSQQRDLAQRLNEKAGELREALRNDRKQQFVLKYVPLPEPLSYAVEFTRAYFTHSVKYLGPLRDEPKPVYPLAGALDPRDVGFKGEHTAAVLDIHKNTIVDYVPSAKFAEGKPVPERQRTTLISAVLDWLSYMGVVQDVKTSDKGKLGHELKVCVDEGSLHDLTHVGVGVSQVLPILVLSLLSDKDATLVFEQPELHLHPRVQTRLADFFISMSMVDKQCVVETHSEYLINRLRFLAAVSDGKSISDRVVMYFVEKSGGRSNYRPIRINEFGVIPDWPKGFFDENEEMATAVLRATVEKRKRLQNA